MTSIPRTFNVSVPETLVAEVAAVDDDGVADVGIEWAYEQTTSCSSRVPSAHFYVMQDTGPLVSLLDAHPLALGHGRGPPVVAFAPVTVAIGEGLTLADVAAVAAGADVTFPTSARRRVAAARTVVDDAVASGDVVHGVTTGFGALANVRVDPTKASDLQHGIVRSHATAVGRPPRETKRERCSSSGPMSWRSAIPVFAPNSSI